MPYATAPATANSATATRTASALAWAEKLVSFDTTSRNSNLAMIHCMRTS